MKNCKNELEKLQYMLKVSDESKQREINRAEEYRKQFENLKQGRNAEIELIENAAHCQTKVTIGHLYKQSSFM